MVINVYMSIYIYKWAAHSINGVVSLTYKLGFWANALEMPGHIQQSMDIVLATACGGLSEMWKIIGIPWQKEKNMVYMSVYHHFWICLVYNIIYIYIYISILIIIHCGYVHDIWLKIAYTWCHLGWLPGYHSHLSIDVTAWGPITYPSIVCVYINIYTCILYM